MWRLAGRFSVRGWTLEPMDFMRNRVRPALERAAETSGSILGSVSGLAQPVHDKRNLNYITAISIQYTEMTCRRPLLWGCHFIRVRRAGVSRSRRVRHGLKVESR